MVLVWAASGPVPRVDQQTLNKKGSLFLARPTLAHHTEDRDEHLERAAAVLGHVAAGTLTVRIGGRYPLAEATRTHEDLVGRRSTGKLLIRAAESSRPGRCARRGQPAVSSQEDRTSHVVVSD